MWDSTCLPYCTTEDTSVQFLCHVFVDNAPLFLMIYFYFIHTVFLD